MIRLFSNRRSFFVSLGLITIVIGYVLLARNSISLAPVLLVLGYCVFIPLALI